MFSFSSSIVAFLLICLIEKTNASCSPSIRITRDVLSCHKVIKDNQEFCAGHSAPTTKSLREQPNYRSKRLCRVPKGTHVIRYHGSCGSITNPSQCNGRQAEGGTCRWSQKLCDDATKPCTPCTPPDDDQIDGAVGVCIDKDQCTAIGGTPRSSKQGALGCGKYVSAATQCCNKSPIAPSATNGQCILDASTYLSKHEYVYVKIGTNGGECAGMTGWMEWEGELVPLETLGQGAGPGHCNAGVHMPKCAYQQVLTGGGWPSNKLVEAICTVRAESSGNPNAMGVNKNSKSSIDIGLMQINTGFGHCATCNMKPEESLCGVYCWQLLDPAANAKCAKKIYDCSRNKFGAWYGYGHKNCHTATASQYLYPTNAQCVVPVGPAAGSATTVSYAPIQPDPVPQIPVVPQDNTRVVVQPNQCPAWLDCTKLSEECRATHSLSEFVRSFFDNPPRECEPLGDDECGAQCNDPPRFTVSGTCTARVRQNYGGECLPVDGCTVSGRAYVRNGQCPGQDYCCAEIRCTPPDIDIAEPFDQERLKWSQCAHVDYCREKGGTPHATNSGYRNACSYHKSSLVQCCEFPKDTVHDVWTDKSYRAYKQDLTILEASSSLLSVSLCVVASLIAFQL